MNIEVVLTQTDPKLGDRGKVVKVAPGFAFNFLIPNKKALLATEANLKGFEREKARQEKSQSEKLTRAQELAAKITALSLTIEVKAGEGNKLYGSVTNHDVHSALTGKGIPVDKKNIHLPEPIHQLGSYQVPVKLHREVTVTLKLTVVKKK